MTSKRRRLTAILDNMPHLIQPIERAKSEKLADVRQTLFDDNLKTEQKFTIVNNEIAKLESLRKILETGNMGLPDTQPPTPTKHETGTQCSTVHSTTEKSPVRNFTEDRVIKRRTYKTKRLNRKISVAKTKTKARMPMKFSWIAWP